MVAAAPVLTYGPTSGFGIGVAGNMAVFKGHPDSTRISSIVASATATTKEQLLINAKINGSSPSNRWHFEGDNRLYWTSQKTYGLGTTTAEEGAVDQKYDYLRFHETLYRRVSRDVYLGGGFLYGIHRDVRPGEGNASAAWPTSPYVVYSEENGFDPDSQTSAGIGVHALLDSRDGPINPTRGWYAGLAYRMFFDGLLGGSSSWQQLSYDARTYLRLSRDARHRLAFWASGDFVTGGTAPYLDLPATGMDTYGRAGRGYPQGRFRGRDLVYGEVEYRFTVTGNGLFGIVAFLNTQTLSDEQSGEKLFDSFATGAGFGLRVMLNKRSQTNLCLDVGSGKDGSSAVYFAVQEAF
jgi:outer membrane protein assembly factor BamA